MMLALLSSRHPQALVDAVADMLVAALSGRCGDAAGAQTRKVEMQPKLKELQLMEANIEEPSIAGVG